MKRDRPFISLTSDFGVQSQGVGTMEATVFSIAPEAKLVHLMHGLPEYDIVVAARTMETVRYLPIGFHVCVCDPGVGTKRKALILKTERGDCLIGPDNGVLLPATRILGGIVEAREVSNLKLMRQPMSFIFHGRDVFAPAAAYLANGVAISKFGKRLNPDSLAPAPYVEAYQKDGSLYSTVIQINRFGSLHLNILHEQWEYLKFDKKKTVKVLLPRNKKLLLPVCKTFGEVAKGKFLILKDDYGRVEVAKNRGSFAKNFSVRIGNKVIIALT